MKKIIFATGNANKMVEVRMILADCGYEIVNKHYIINNIEKK